MVRDLMLNIAEGDFRTEDKSSASEPVFDVTWAPIFDEDEDSDSLICNIIIPIAYRSLLTYTDGELTICFQTPYRPDFRPFSIRFLALNQDGSLALYENTGPEGVGVLSYTNEVPWAVSIPASQLFNLNGNGQYLVRLIQASEDSQLAGSAFIYSASKTDIHISFSDNQSAQLLSLCAPGKNFRYPTTGVGITSYLNTVIDHTDFNQILAQQFEADGKPLRNAIFDNSNCNLDVLFSPENEKSDVGLMDVTYLDLSTFQNFLDTPSDKTTLLPEYIGEGEPDEPDPNPQPDPELPINAPDPLVPNYRLIDRGDWALGEEYYYKDINPVTGTWEISQVYHNGCRWQCVRNGVIEEPHYPSENWHMVMGFLSNFDFAKGLDHWMFDCEAEFLSLENKWIWANSNTLSFHGNGTSITTVNDKKVIVVRNSTLTQKLEDFQGYPTIKPKDGVKKAVTLYLTFLYKVIKPGHLSVSFLNTDMNGFEDFQPFSHETDLGANDSFEQMTLSGLWNGTGDFTLAFTGEILIYRPTLSIDRADVLSLD